MESLNFNKVTLVAIPQHIFQIITLSYILYFFMCSCMDMHVARMGEERGVYRVLVGKPEVKRDHWGDLGVDGWIILGWITRRWDVGMWT